MEFKVIVFDKFYQIHPLFTELIMPVKIFRYVSKWHIIYITPNIEQL